MVFLRIYKTETTELKEENTYEETSKNHVAQTEIMTQMSLSFNFLLFLSGLFSFSFPCSF